MYKKVLSESEIMNLYNIGANDEPACEHECSEGATKCSGELGVQSCYDTNNNGCREWGLISQCNSGQVCQEGNCVLVTPDPEPLPQPIPECSDECIENNLRCDNYNLQQCL